MHFTNSILGLLSIFKFYKAVSILQCNICDPTVFSKFIFYISVIFITCYTTKEHSRIVTSYWTCGPSLSIISVSVPWWRSSATTIAPSITAITTSSTISTTTSMWSRTWPSWAASASATSPVSSTVSPRIRSYWTSITFAPRSLIRLTSTLFRRRSWSLRFWPYLTFLTLTTFTLTTFNTTRSLAFTPRFTFTWRTRPTVAPGLFWAIVSMILAFHLLTPSPWRSIAFLWILYCHFRTWLICQILGNIIYNCSIH